MEKWEEERNLKVFENRILMPRVMRMWSGIGSTMRNFSFYLSPNKFWILIWTGHVVRMKEGWSAFKIRTGKPIGKRSLWLKSGFILFFI